MYNRILKRPMFRIGGQAGQGTGIMSHVEPKPKYVVGGRVGYAQAGQVTNPFTYFSPLTVPRAGYPTTSYSGGLDLLEQSRKFDEQQRALQKKNREQLGILPAVPTDVSTDVSTDDEDFLSKIFGSDAEKLMKEKGILSANPTTKEKINAINFLQNKKDENNEKKPLPAATNKPKYTETQKTDPKQAIKEEADFIRDLIKDEDMTTAEAAFVVAKALATPGGIGEKVRAANELLIPMAKEKAKTKKDITLEAYKAYKDKQLEEIKAGKLSDWGKAVREAAENARLAGDERPIEEIIKGYNEMKFGDEKFIDKIIAGKLQNDVITIDNKIRSNEEYEFKIANKEKVTKDETKIYEQNKRLIEKFKLTNPELFKKIAPSYVGAKDGGRIGFAYGSPEQEQQPQVESTTLNQNDDQTQLKPVIKLSYQELRARLPKEISDNIVLLISNSDQALQDFAYIATQQDINDFNVKYGVNLVLPSNK